MADQPRTSETTNPAADRWAAERTSEQESADNDVSRYPHRFEMRGKPQSLTWPGVCANCGESATERIRVRRAFYRHGRGRHYAGVLGYRVVSADIPFCGSCAARHRREARQVPWMRRYGWFVFNPAHIATVGCAVLLALALPSALETPFAASGGTVAWGLIGVLVFGMVWTIGVTWWMTRPNRFEPRTEITSACAISHDVSQYFEGRRHIYGLQNRAFALAFEQANRSRIWTERDQSRMWRKSLVATILLIVVVGGARLLLWLIEGR